MQSHQVQNPCRRYKNLLNGTNIYSYAQAKDIHYKLYNNQKKYLQKFLICITIHLLKFYYTLISYLIWLYLQIFQNYFKNKDDTFVTLESLNIYSRLYCLIFKRNLLFSNIQMKSIITKMQMHYQLQQLLQSQETIAFQKFQLSLKFLCALNCDFQQILVIVFMILYYDFMVTMFKMHVIKIKNTG
eukprot:TRINITY_DN2666_c0_g1_i6.p2 TRINITY_DN2666_c0_g1~~TRINITY_DN2666_c0_g1_i6.p2  ORF type:complete len:186 (-),score=-22.11 TRINITY_DN2666_c0_g1_i6:21-578(-)